MYLVTSKSPMGQIRHAIAATLDLAASMANRMRDQNPMGMVLIERPNGATIFGNDDKPVFPLEATEYAELAPAGW
jgi:hypothetical protein